MTHNTKCRRCGTISTLFIINPIIFAIKFYFRFNRT